MERSFYVASHGYTGGREDFELTEATHTSEKPDSTWWGRKGSTKIVWPKEADIEEYKDSPIAYSHLEDSGEWSSWLDLEHVDWVSLGM